MVISIYTKKMALKKMMPLLRNENYIPGYHLSLLAEPAEDIFGVHIMIGIDMIGGGNGVSETTLDIFRKEMKKIDRNVSFVYR